MVQIITVSSKVVHRVLVLLQKVTCALKFFQTKEKSESKLANAMSWSNELRGNGRTKHTFSDL